MENGDDLLRIFLSRRSLISIDSIENLPCSQKSSSRTFRLNELKGRNGSNGHVTYSDSEAEKLIQFDRVSHNGIHYEDRANGYEIRPSSDGSFKYSSTQININSIEKLNLVECGSTITSTSRDSIDSLNSTKNTEHDEDRYSIDSFNECYPKHMNHVKNGRITTKRRVSPIDELSENSINSAKLKEYFALREREKLLEDQEIDRIILEAHKMNANRPVSRKQSNYDLLKNGGCQRNSQKVQQNNYILFYNEFFETSSARDDNCEMTPRHDESHSKGTTLSDSRSNLLELERLNMSKVTSSCCCVKLFKSMFSAKGSISNKKIDKKKK